MVRTVLHRDGDCDFITALNAVKTKSGASETHVREIPI